MFSLNRAFSSLRLKTSNSLPGVIILLFTFSLIISILSFFFLVLTYWKFVRIVSTFSTVIIFGFF